MLVDEPVRIIDWLKRLALISTLRSMSVPCLNCVILLELEALRIGLELICSVDGLRSSLWLQFKPHHIAAGAAYLAAKFLNFDLASYHDIWREFQTTPAILQGNPSYMKGLKLSLF
ncbi:hypothetical protein Gotur_002748 [Gossypium turneri]